MLFGRYFIIVPVLAIAALTNGRILYNVPFPWSGLMVLGELLALAGLGIAFVQTDVWEFIGLRQLGEIDRPTQLFTGGLYSIVRHPLYVTGLVFIWLFPTMTISLLIINAALTLYILIGAYFEERKLRREFGLEYIDYVTVTPMLIPLIKRRKPGS